MEPAARVCTDTQYGVLYYESHRLPVAVMGLLRPLVAKAARVFCRAGHWGPHWHTLYD